MNVQAWVAQARPPRRRSAVLRPIGPTVACEKALLAIGTRILRQAAERIASEVMPAVLSGKAQMMRDELSWFERAMRALRDFIDGLVGGAREEMRSAFETEDQRHSRRFNEAMRSAIGIDLGKVIVGEGLKNTIEAATQRNVALIRGLTDDVAKRIEIALIDAMTNGVNNRVIATMLAREFGIGRRRAALIARDQAASFNGSLNRIRQVAMGVTEYVWSTSMDERVRGNPEGRYPNARPSHWDREGKRFKWSDAPEDGHPGQPINCRCTARAVIEF
jgi:SPP1 gp7 family putative phage head morphogenesis protein